MIGVYSVDYLTKTFLNKMKSHADSLSIILFNSHGDCIGKILCLCFISFIVLSLSEGQVIMRFQIFQLSNEISFI